MKGGGLTMRIIGVGGDDFALGTVLRSAWGCDSVTGGWEKAIIT